MAAIAKQSLSQERKFGGDSSHTTYPVKYALVFVLLRFVVDISTDVAGLLRYLYPYPSGLLHWHWGKDISTDVAGFTKIYLPLPFKVASLVLGRCTSEETMEDINIEVKMSLWTWGTGYIMRYGVHIMRSKIELCCIFLIALRCIQYRGILNPVLTRH